MANGQQEEEGKKNASFDEVVNLVTAIIKTPEGSGNYHDYTELCKLYDKNENGTMMLAELENILSNLADEIPKEDTLALLAELADAEDEDGFFPYAPFLDRLCGKA
jgi:Ca2+-binding EF-hand superfamily protein